MARSVDEGRIRLIARGSDVPALRNMTSRLQVVNAAGLERRKDVLKRYMAAYREALDWMYADPAAIDAYAEWSKLPRPIDAAEHGAAANLGTARHHGRRGEVQIHPGAAE
jgi:ABC-type nitrate/sulfonate/bicarbonate transport system substrate-binding protein